MLTRSFKGLFKVGNDEDINKLVKKGPFDIYVSCCDTPYFYGLPPIERPWCGILTLDLISIIDQSKERSVAADKGIT